MQLNLNEYYYRPSMTEGPESYTHTLQGLDGVSGKRVEDFLPRDWYSSAVYRNILDMINTLQVTRNKLLGGTYGHFFITPTYNRMPQKTILGLNFPGSYETPPDQDGMTRWVQTTSYKNNEKAFWGFAAKKIGNHGDWTIPAYIKTHVFGEKSGAAGAPNYPAQSIPAFVKKVTWAGYKKWIYKGHPFWLTKSITTGDNSANNKRIMAGNGYSSMDIVNLTRSLDWEMNRVHLPLPFNLRQWATKYNQLAMSNSSISWAERVTQLVILNKWLVIMKEKIRAAITKSNLTLKVAEESLRKEDARILKEQADEQAAREQKRLLEIEKERAEAQAIIDAEKLKLAEEAKAQAQKEAAEATEQARIKAQEKLPVSLPAPISVPVPTIPTPTPSIPYQAVPVVEKKTGILPIAAIGAALFYLLG